MTRECDKGTVLLSHLTEVKNNNAGTIQVLFRPVGFQMEIIFTAELFADYITILRIAVIPVVQDHVVYPEQCFENRSCRNGFSVTSICYCLVYQLCYLVIDRLEALMQRTVFQGIKI